MASFLVIDQVVAFRRATASTDRWSQLAVGLRLFQLLAQIRQFLIQRIELAG